MKTLGQIFVDINNWEIPRGNPKVLGFYMVTKTFEKSTR